MIVAKRTPISKVVELMKLPEGNDTIYYKGKVSQLLANLRLKHQTWGHAHNPQLHRGSLAKVDELFWHIDGYDGSPLALPLHNLENIILAIIGPEGTWFKEKDKVWQSEPYTVYLCKYNAIHASPLTEKSRYLIRYWVARTVWPFQRKELVLEP